MKDDEPVMKNVGRKASQAEGTCVALHWRPVREGRLENGREDVGEGVR